MEADKPTVMRPRGVPENLNPDTVFFFVCCVLVWYFPSIGAAGKELGFLVAIGFGVGTMYAAKAVVRWVRSDLNVERASRILTFLIGGWVLWARLTGMARANDMQNGQVFLFTLIAVAVAYARRRPNERGRPLPVRRAVRAGFKGAAVAILLGFMSEPEKWTFLALVSAAVVSLLASLGLAACIFGVRGFSRAVAVAVPPVPDVAPMGGQDTIQ